MQVGLKKVLQNHNFSKNRINFKCNKLLLKNVIINYETI
jgi:hypothetical protein